jgi:hypothetical protein
VQSTGPIKWLQQTFEVVLYMEVTRRAKDQAATVFEMWPRRKSACICARQVGPGARKRTVSLRGFQKAFGAGRTTYVQTNPGALVGEEKMVLELEPDGSRT